MKKKLMCKFNIFILGEYLSGQQLSVYLSNG